MSNDETTPAETPVNPYKAIFEAVRPVAVAAERNRVEVEQQAREARDEALKAAETEYAAAKVGVDEARKAMESEFDANKRELDATLELTRQAVQDVFDAKVRKAREDAKAAIEAIANRTAG